MASISVQASAYGNTAVFRQFPKIDMANPAESFFELIRAGKYQDSATEYGAKNTVREYGVIARALQERCLEPTFPNETVAEQMIERLLQETDNPERFHMVRQIVLTMRDQQFETQFARMAEITCYLSYGNTDADGMIQSLLQEKGSMEFAEFLVKIYGDKPGSATFSNLMANIRRVAGGDVDAIAAAVAMVKLSDNDGS